MEKTKKISILMPTYNDADTIEKSLDSIVSQTYENLEVLIMNDGSKDDTKKVVIKYIKENKLKAKIHYFEQENQDQLNAILNLLNKIHGDYVFLFHSDDLLASDDVFEKCISEMQKDSSIDSLIGDYTIIDNDLNITSKFKTEKYRNNIKDVGRVILLYGKNYYGDFGFHKTSTFLNKIKSNYVIWNTPFWINYSDKEVEVLNIKKVNFSLLKYRIYENNYNTNIIGKHNVLNGELRSLVLALNNFSIPLFDLQRLIFKLLKKRYIRNLGLFRYFPIVYKNKPSKNIYKIVKGAIESTFPNDYKENPWLNGLINFYSMKSNRIIEIPEINEKEIYYGKDLRKFTTQLFNNNLPSIYYYLFDEMNKGFGTIAVENENEKGKIESILKFLCVARVDILIKKEQQKEIPKIIHYVWMGGKEKPKSIRKCMKTWDKFSKDYKVIEWNENNFDIKSHPFVEEAYKQKKWAFVSDYVRAWVLYNYGGIYMDTDVFVIDNLDSLLSNKAFVGFENEGYPFTAVFGCVKKHSLVKSMLDYYDNLKNYEFNFQNNNTLSVSEILINKYNCSPVNKEQLIKDDIRVYKDTVLCNPSRESKTVHLFYGSWVGNTSLERKVHRFIREHLNSKFNIKIYLFYKKIFKRAK